MDTLAQKGRPHRGASSKRAVSYGYQRDNQRLVINEGEARRVRQILARYARANGFKIVATFKDNYTSVKRRGRR